MFRFFFTTIRLPPYFFFFFFNDTATTEIYTLSLHDALPISSQLEMCQYADGFIQNNAAIVEDFLKLGCRFAALMCGKRSEEHTSELQSQSNLVCRLLLEKKKKKI